MVPLGLAGAAFGATFTMRVDADSLKRFAGGMILLLIVVLLSRPRLGRETGPPRAPRWAVGAAALPLGFYEGMLGSGNGLVATLLFCSGRGFDVLAALGHYCVLAFAWCALAAGIYIGHGFRDVALVAPAVAGSCAGGFLGSRIASARGTGFVRGLFAVAGTALGVKLVLGI